MGFTETLLLLSGCSWQQCAKEADYADVVFEVPVLFLFLSGSCYSKENVCALGWERDLPPSCLEKNEWCLSTTSDWSVSISYTTPLMVFQSSYWVIAMLVVTQCRLSCGFQGHWRFGGTGHGPAFSSSGGLKMFMVFSNILKCSLTQHVIGRLS